MSEQDSMDYVRELPGFERGHPHYFKDPMIDHLLEIVLQLGAETWVNRDRQLVMEHLLATEGKVTPEMIEQFDPPPEFKEQLRAQRRSFTNRLYGSLYEGLDGDGDQTFNPGMLADKKS